MSEQRPDVGQVLNPFTRFRAWAAYCHHYPVLEAIARYRVLEADDPAAIDEMVAKFLSTNTDAGSHS